MSSILWLWPRFCRNSIQERRLLPKFDRSRPICRRVSVYAPDHVFSTLRLKCRPLHSLVPSCLHCIILEGAMQCAFRAGSLAHLPFACSESSLRSRQAQQRASLLRRFVCRCISGNIFVQLPGSRIAARSRAPCMNTKSAVDHLPACLHPGTTLRSQPVRDEALRVPFSLPKACPHPYFPSCAISRVISVWSFSRRIPDISSFQLPTATQQQPLTRKDCQSRTNTKKYVQPDDLVLQRISQPQMPLGRSSRGRSLGGWRSRTKNFLSNSNEAINRSTFGRIFRLRGSGHVCLVHFASFLLSCLFSGSTAPL